MTIQNNRMDVVLSNENITKMKEGFKLINSVLEPIAQGLTATERQTLPKMDVSNKSFVGDAILAVKNNPDFLPAYLTANAMDNDYQLYLQLDEFLGLTETLLEKLSDTQMLAGSEAYSNALVAYRLFGSAAKAGLNGADSVYDKLASRFAGQGPSGSSTAPAAPATATA